MVKVTYEFTEEDSSRRKIYEISSDMFSALWDIQNYMRDLRKGYVNDDIEKIIDTVHGFLYDSKVDEIE